MTKFAPYAKSIVAFLLAGLTALGTALTDGSVTTQEWVAVAIASLATTGAVFAVPNTPAVVDPLNEDLGDPNTDAG